MFFQKQAQAHEAQAPKVGSQAYVRQLAKEAFERVDTDFSAQAIAKGTA